MQLRFTILPSSTFEINRHSFSYFHILAFVTKTFVKYLFASSAITGFPLFIFIADIIFLSNTGLVSKYMTGSNCPAILGFFSINEAMSYSTQKPLCLFV